ncbi:MAG: Pls/PosA family non-ribosomal peptide synthetase, partial [Candidatus Dormibacteraceae bacterium]
LALTSWTFYRDTLADSLMLYFGGILAGLVLVFTMPRVLNLTLKPDQIYPLYCFRYSLQRTISRLTNIKLFTYLFGDSSYIVGYLRVLGYNLSQVEQTGSNFGVEVKHEIPFLSSIGSGTMVSDGLSLINAEFSNTSFRVAKTSIGPRNFLGNNIVYPAQGRTGDNCLLATKVMIPLDGKLRENVGLLGSPCFEIPRSVQRDSQFDHLKNGVELRRGLAAKNRHNTVTMGLYLLLQCLGFCGILLVNLAASTLYDRIGSIATAAGIFGSLIFMVTYWVLVERAVHGFRVLKPRFCSIYDPIFWQHERFWKMSAGRYLAFFNGTPFKNLIWRLLGVRMGSRVFDDGCAIPEKTLVTIGNDSVLNSGSTIQCHSLEDGTFKSDHITIGTGCTIGTNAFVHYSAIIGESAVLAPDSFLMKGGEMAPYTQWRGNPATEVPACQP